MTYHRGTIEEFNTWHAIALYSEGLPKIGYVNGQPAPQNQQTTSYSNAIQNPNKTNDYVWAYGKYPIVNKAVLTEAAYKALNWFPVDEIV